MEVLVNDLVLQKSTEIHAERSSVQLQEKDQACCAKVGISSLSQLFSAWHYAFSGEWHHVAAIFSLERQWTYNCTSGTFPERLSFKLYNRKTSKKKIDKFY